MFLVVIILSTSRLQAQVDSREGKIVNDGYPGGIVETWNLEKPGVTEGSFFINENWHVGNVLLKNGRAINGLPIKYNLRDEQLLLLDENKISRIIPQQQIKEFRWFDNQKRRDEYFINGIAYNLKGVPLAGIMEILTSNGIELLLYRQLILSKGNYSLIHDAGQKNDEYLINDVYYLASDKSLFEIKNKKALYDFAGKYQDNVKTYIKSNRLQFKDRDDLILIVDYYNRLLKEEK